MFPSWKYALDSFFQQVIFFFFFFFVPKGYLSFLQIFEKSEGSYLIQWGSKGHLWESCLWVFLFIRDEWGVDAFQTVLPPQKINKLESQQGFSVAAGCALSKCGHQVSREGGWVPCEVVELKDKNHLGCHVLKRQRYQVQNEFLGSGFHIVKESPV